MSCNDISNYKQGVRCNENYIKKQSYTFRDSKVYLNGVYRGDIIEQNESTLKFKMVSDNQYMNGIIRTINFVHV